MNSKIDILLATYNGEKYLKEQLNSIFSQSFQDFHLLIRDDGSTDNTQSIIRDAAIKHPKKITFLEDLIHVGAIDSFSRLLCASKAPYVMFADQDDVWLKDKILITFNKMQQMEKLYGKKKPILVHGDLKVVDKNLRLISPSYWSYTKINPKEGSHLNRLMVQNEITGCTVMINRPLADTAKPIFLKSVMHDWWLGLVAAAFGHIGIINKPLILYRQHGNNTLGAKKFGLSFNNKRSKHQDQKRSQASELLERYKNTLSLPNTEMISDYISMKESSIFRNRYLQYKHGFFKQGFLRNFYQFLLMRAP